MRQVRPTRRLRSKRRHQPTRNVCVDLLRQSKASSYRVVIDIAGPVAGIFVLLDPRVNCIRHLKHNSVEKRGESTL